MLRDLDGMLVQFLVFAVCCCVCVAACNSVYILLVPGNEDHQWLMEFRCPLSLVTLEDDCRSFGLWCRVIGS